MRMILKPISALMLTALVGAGFASCDNDDKTVAVPIAPILKEVQFPAANTVVPGKTAMIVGLGFSKTDVVYLRDVNTDARMQVDVVAVTDYDITILVPEDAGGEYEVIIQRAGLETALDGVFTVPLIVPLSDVVMPAGAVQRGSEITIKGKGFAAGDIIALHSAFYPEGVEFAHPVTLTDEGVKVTLSNSLYGANNVVVKRGDRMTNLGTLTIATNVGDKVGGGVVFYTFGEHGLIVNMRNVGSATEQFGPEVAPGNAAGTTQGIGTGALNTQNIIKKFNALQEANNWPEWVGVTIAAQWCANNKVTADGGEYADWFLPSREELIELFKVKNTLKAQGVNIPANNYWTSSEYADGPGWAAYYVNFYEDTKLVSEPCSKSGWKIGVLPVRAY